MSESSGMKPFDPTHAIVPTAAIPIAVEDVTELAVRILVDKGVSRLEGIANEVNRLLNLDDGDPLVEIADWDVMITKGSKLNLLVRNFRQRGAQINSSYHARGNSIMRLGEQMKHLPFSISWRFPSADEAKQLYQSGAFTVHVGKTFGNALPAGGISLQNEGYFLFSQECQYSYDNTNHHVVADIWVAGVPQASKLQFLIEKKLIPVNLQPLKTDFHLLSALLNQGLVIIREDAENIKVEASALLLKQVISGDVTSVCGLEISEQSVAQQAEELLRETTKFLKESDLTSAIRGLLERDLRRANITAYDPMQLEDPNRGSWELWDGQDAPGFARIPSPKTLYARDPRRDIQRGGVIGIDFGTKSTVVVYRDSSGVIQPMRIGVGEFDRALRKSDYENPTVMQFIDIEHFEEAYAGDTGRPLTSWQDLTVSHTAFNAWKDSEKSNDFFSFFGELKQWAGSPDRQARIRDQQGYEISLPPYETLKEGDFDPIERYAYYIGLYINNMHTGRIYLEYLLSFPVTYPQRVRKRLLESFRRGLRRSLPQTVLSDPECMSCFRVEQGAGEPAAYAVCALQEYRIIPQEGESILYGVFDFGGGTTDFDFGIWRRAAGAKERRYSYVIQHFGGSGDPYLGGENLLELLAFETFKENRDELLAKKITFARPPQCRVFPGSEALISDSQEARSNLRKLMEALRPLWERHPDYESLYADGVLKLQLFRQDGRSEDGFELRVDAQRLENLIREQIQKCVNEFFDALLSVFTGDAYQKACVGRTHGQIHLFLAGNSSKSEILKEVFQQTMEDYNQKYNDQLEQAGVPLDENNDSHFKLFYPLGTPESDEQLQALGVGQDASRDFERPTGKTGVAIGLVQCRKGSKIKAVSEKPDTEEIHFRYWIGDDAEGWFQPIITRSSPYQKWVEYLDAGVDCFEFYYTSSPSAERRLPTSETRNAHLQLPEGAVNEDWMVYLRPVSPNELEYVVAESLDAANAGDYRSEIQKFVLSEG